MGWHALIRAQQVQCTSSQCSSIPQPLWDSEADLFGNQLCGDALLLTRDHMAISTARRPLDPIHRNHRVGSEESLEQLVVILRGQLKYARPPPQFDLRDGRPRAQPFKEPKLPIVR